MTPDLFENFSFTRTGQSIVPPSAEELARARRDLGIARAADHADRVSPEWKAKALAQVKAYAALHPHFLAEHARGFAEANGLPAAVEPRAWGNVMRCAAFAGFIVADGYAPANSSNRSPKTLWRSSR